jgi:hypothetical protein
MEVFEIKTLKSSIAPCVIMCYKLLFPIKFFKGNYMNRLVLLAVFSLILPLAASAEETTATTTQAPAVTESVTAASDDSRWYGFFELRPSYTSLNGEWHTENTAEAGYYFTKKARLYYTQWFNSNIYNPLDETKGLDVYADDGLFRAKINDFLVSGDTSLSWQGRLYMPTKKTKRDAGYITGLRNYLVLTEKMSQDLSVDFSVAPTLYAYDRASFNNEANPFFLQQVSLNADYKFTEDLVLSLPLVYEGTRFRSAAGAKNDGQWGHFLYTWPELNYTINTTHTVGVSYYSGNFVTDDASAFQITKGLETGVYQAVWAVNL